MLLLNACRNVFQLPKLAYLYSTSACFLFFVFCFLFFVFCFLFLFFVFLFLIFFDGRRHALM